MTKATGSNSRRPPLSNLSDPFGASPEEWAHFDLVLGLTADLLPVVSNPGAKISPASKMATLGKPPSRYNKAGFAAGVVGWTQHVTTPAMVERWASEPDYGICVQTRTVRAIDCDLTDQAFSSARAGSLAATPKRANANIVARTLTCGSAPRPMCPHSGHLKTGLEMCRVERMRPSMSRPSH